MKDKLKGIVIGIVIGALLVPTVFATVGTVTKELLYNNIKITMNGNELIATDANGQPVEPFIIDGTTYLPVRGIANALDLGVEWDGETNTVKLSTEKKESSTSGKTSVGDVIYDEDGVRVTLTEIEDGNHLETFTFLIENTTDSIVSFVADDMSTNDFMAHDSFGIGSIQPHKKSLENLYLSVGEYSQHKKDKIEKLEFTARHTVYSMDLRVISEGEKLITLYL